MSTSGRGSNIRSLEHLPIDGIATSSSSTRGAVASSSFDGLRREVARLLTVTKLARGRPDPTQHAVETSVAAEVEEVVRQAGEQVFRGNCELPRRARPDPRSAPLCKSSARTSSSTRSRWCISQGSWQPRLEASVQTAKRAAMLLHDLAGHDARGGGLARASSPPSSTPVAASPRASSIEAHHYEVQPRWRPSSSSLGEPPGARGESLEAYIKRLEALELAALPERGVEKVYALQAGQQDGHEWPGDVGRRRGGAPRPRDRARDRGPLEVPPVRWRVTVIRETARSTWRRTTRRRQRPRHQQPEPAADSPIQAA